MSTSITCPFCGAKTDFLSSKQVARLLGKSPVTIVRWIDKGRFPGTVKVPGATTPWIFKIPASAVLPLIEEKERKENGQA